MIITREKGMRMWGGGSGSTSASGVNGGGGFSLAVEEGEGTGNAYTDFTYESGTLTLNKATEFVTVDFFNKLFTAYDANGNAIVPNDTTTAINNLKLMVGTWTEQYLSALGSNSEGGGSGAGLEDVWDSLTNQQGTVITDNTKIAIAHIPDTSSTYGYLKSSALNGYATQSWVNQQGFLTTHQTLYTLSIYGGTTKVLDFKPNANASIYIKAGGDISLTNDTTNKYITLSYTHPTNGANTTISAASGKVLSAITVNSLGHVTSVSSKTLASADIPDISATYATASRATTLEGYFTDGVAKTAAKLNTGTTTYTAWGQTYWSSGVPQSVSGNMTSVGSITPSANGNALGTTSARFNIYGTAGNFSGKVSISGTLGVTGATTLSSTLSVAGGITLTTTKRIYFGDTSHYLELDSTGFHFSHGVYSDSFVSALGSNSSGGGSGTFDEEAMWEALGTTSTAKVIASSHIPNLSASKITSGTLADARIPSLAASKITSGTFDTARIPNLDASKITSGTFAAARIPVATASAVGGIKVGTTLAISDGVLNQKSGIATAGTYRSVTVDTYGRVTAGTNPTTLSGYGITNAYTKTQVDTALSGYLPLSGGTMTGNILFNTGDTTEKSVIFQTNRKTEGGGGWAYTPIAVRGANSSVFFHIGVYGNDNTLSYAYLNLGGAYSSANSLRIYNGTSPYPAWGTDKLLHEGNYSSYALPLTGGTMSDSIKMDAANKGYYLVDSAGVSYPALFDNGGYLCIGANATSGTHHTGSTYISAGSGEVYIIRLVNNSRTTYKNLDAGNTYVSSGKGYINGTEITTITGNAATATKATQDGSGNTITSTYLPLSGGTMTGTLKWANGTALPNATTADYLLTIDAFASGGTTKWIVASSVTVGRATNADNADKLDGIDSRSIDSIYTGGWCAGTGTYYGKIAEYTSGTSGTVDCTATFLLTDYNTSGASSGNILVVRFRSSSPTTAPAINASWAVKNSDMDVYVRYQISNSRTYVRIYSRSSGWGRAINIKLLRSHSWSGSNITSWNLYSATNTTSGDVAAYSSLPTAETAVTVTNNNIIAGEVTATSDERLKTIVGDGNLDLRYIANAPNILFKWNNGQDDKVHGGSLAQYFLHGAKHFVLGNDKDYYSLNYGALATSMAISIAKEVVKHEDRITLLEKENAKLKARVAELEERRA